METVTLERQSLGEKRDLAAEYCWLSSLGAGVSPGFLWQLSSGDYLKFIQINTTPRNSFNWELALVWICLWHMTYELHLSYIKYFVSLFGSKATCNEPRNISRNHKENWRHLFFSSSLPELWTKWWQLARPLACERPNKVEVTFHVKLIVVLISVLGELWKEVGGTNLAPNGTHYRHCTLGHGRTVILFGSKVIHPKVNNITLQLLP